MEFEEMTLEDNIKLKTSKSRFQIPTCFEKCAFKTDQAFCFRVTNFYDPSKFWIAIKYKELEAFQKYLFRSYYIDGVKFKVPLKNIEKDLYCIVLSDGGYYRGVIVGFPCTFSKIQTIQVHLIDYGMIRSVEINNIYYMKEIFLNVPQFAIRACLGRVCPKGGGPWTTADITDFHKLIRNKILVGLVINVDPGRQLLELHLSEKMKDAVTVPIHKIFIKEKRMQYTFDCEKSISKKTANKPYLFPSHEILESGKVPLTWDDAELQKITAANCEILQRYNNLE